MLWWGHDDGVYRVSLVQMGGEPQRA
jgi:hypothetical protein